MVPSAVRETEHVMDVRVPATEMYRLIEDTERWPLVFPPSVHVDRLERTGDDERIRLWAWMHGEVATWTSRRVLDPVALRVRFRQEVSTPPVAAMGGAWVLEPLGPQECRVRLLHDFRAVDDDPSKLSWIEAAVDRNSRAELAALRDHAENAAALSARTLSFEDTVRIRGTAEDVYAFIRDAGHWPRRLPHVAAVDLDEKEPGVQRLGMQTRTADGATHRTESVRVCLPGRIVYKQTRLPALLTAHTGCWHIEAEGPADVTVTSRHTAVIDPAAVPAVLGTGAGLAKARDHVRAALGGNSLATLRHAADHAKARLGAV
ncbi:aromatase/cyclase [Streptomyces sp. NPDC000070]|uniref:aromatase/cyclase n=1 Tax=Streptomyces sp. NPDC000070 TaxID=3154240 RepID=UPI003330AE31